jgi:hypothetical protein
LAASRAAADPAAGAPPDSSQDPALDAIRFYQRSLSSLRHVRCRFTPSCSQYAVEAIEAYGWVEGSARAADRLMRCNASAAGHYPRAADGSLLDPVTNAGEPSVAVRAPAWLLPGLPGDPPAAGNAGDADSAAARSAVRDALSFARALEAQGDCYRAATEYQRFAHLRGDTEAPSWAFARIGACFARGAEWSEAQSAFFTAALLARDTLSRARAVTLEAASRFNGGDFEGADRRLAEDLPGSDPAARLALRGLCAAEWGEWESSRALFDRAAAAPPSPEAAPRLARLAHGLEGGPNLPHRSPGACAVMSAILPGSGQMAAGRVEDGLRHLLFNAALIVTVVQFAREQHYGAAYVTAAIELPFYLGNISGARTAARQVNREKRRALIARAIADSDR